MGTNDNNVPETIVDGSGAGVIPENSGNGSAGSTPAWMAQLPNDLKTNEGLAQYKTLGDAIKGLMESKTETKTEETKKEPVKYENFGRKFEADVDPFGDFGTGLKNYLESKGVSQADAEEMFDKMTENFTNAKNNMIQRGREYCEKTVRSQWGNEYEAKRNLMARGYQALGDTDGSLQKALDESGASIVPAVWELLSRVGSMVSEDTGSPRRTGEGKPSHPDGVPVDYSKPST